MHVSPDIAKEYTTQKQIQTNSNTKMKIDLATIKVRELIIRAIRLVLNSWWMVEANQPSMHSTKSVFRLLSTINIHTHKHTYIHTHIHIYLPWRYSRDICRGLGRCYSRCKGRSLKHNKGWSEWRQIAIGEQGEEKAGNTNKT